MGWRWRCSRNFEVDRCLSSPPLTLSSPLLPLFNLTIPQQAPQVSPWMSLGRRVSVRNTCHSMCYQWSRRYSRSLSPYPSFSLDRLVSPILSSPSLPPFLIFHLVQVSNISMVKVRTTKRNIKRFAKRSCTSIPHATPSGSHVSNQKREGREERERGREKRRKKSILWSIMIT